MNVFSRNPCFNSQATVWFSKCLQLSISVSLETVFRNQLISRNQFLRGNVFTQSFPRNGLHVTIESECSLRVRQWFPNLSQMKPIYTWVSQIVFLLRFTGYNFVCISRLSPVYNIPHPCHPTRINNANSVTTMQIIDPLLSSIPLFLCRSITQQLNCFHLWLVHIPVTGRTKYYEEESWCPWKFLINCKIYLVLNSA
jgi:hypothetical protein